MPPIFNSLQFWTLVAGLAAFTTRYYFPAFPLDEAGILALLLFVLGLIGVVPTLRTYGFKASLATASFYNSLAFWQLVAGLVFFVLRYFAPTLPIDEAIILAVILFVLAALGIVPELRARGLML
jgi:hypothetical protein